MKKTLVFLLSLIMAFGSFCACYTSSSNDNLESDNNSQDNIGEIPDKDNLEKLYKFETPEILSISECEQITELDDGYSISNGKYSLSLETRENYILQLTSLKDNEVKFENKTPASISVTTNRKLTETETLAVGYSEIYGNKYGGMTGKATLISSAGSIFSLYDEYYVTTNVFNIRRTVTCDEANENAGYTTEFSLEAVSNASSYTDCEYFIPANIYSTSKNYLTAGYSNKGFSVSDAKNPATIALMRVNSSGETLSIARKNPYISTSSSDSGGYGKSKDYKYGSLGIYRGVNVGVRLDYPCQEEGVNTLAHKFAEVCGTNDIRFDATIFVENTEDYITGMTAAYLEQTGVQAISNTEVDLTKAYDYNITDLNAMAYNSNGVTLLPFARYVESGTGFSYYAEAGYIGMQISLGYEMYRYGIKNNNKTSYDLGLSILNMWANTSTYPGTTSGVFRCYRSEGGYFGTAPTLRIMTDGAEGMLDALRLAESVDTKTNVTAWKNLVTGYANFLVNSQNADGSWYRAYDYDGNKLVEENRFGITVNSDTISDSKLNTQIPVRFLVRMFEYTGNTKYLNVAKKAGQYVYSEIIPQGQFSGGTLDTQGVVDRESGIFCEYAMNALYSVTGEEKWLTAAEQAAIYSFSWTFINDFIVYNTRNLKAGIATSLGYTAGMSIISTAGYGADTFISYMYYDLFKLYAWTGNAAYLNMSLISQNLTKRNMDIYGIYGYKYRSYAIEATNISLFRFITAEETGVWLPWITNAYVEPMTNMAQTFGCYDVNIVCKNNTSKQIKEKISAYGAGGKIYGEIK